MIVTKIPVLEKTKPRVCAYVRVSTDKEAQEDSFAVQSAYWDKHLGEDQSICYVGLFTDNGISGKQMRNRKGLNEMLKKVRAGEIDSIYTKSISRFARNYTELMAVVRELRDKGIPIIFEKENLNTLDPKSGLVLSVMASLAEEELYSMSKNQQWAIRKRFAEGIIEIGHVYGYYCKNRQLTVNPQEAEVVRLVFKLYLEGNGMTKIASILDKTEYAPKRGGSLWNKESIRNILTNEKYIGDVLLQKGIYNVKSKKINRGELPQYYVENNHEAIISKEDFAEAQRLMQARAEKYTHSGIGKNTYPLSLKIICGQCGSKYKRKTIAKGKTYEAIKWSCTLKDEKTKAACDSHEIKEEVITNLLVAAFNECLSSQYIGVGAEEENRKLQALLGTEQELKRLHVKGYVSDTQYRVEVEKILEEIRQCEERIKASSQNSKMKKLKKSAEFTQDMADFLISAIVKDWTVTFKFANGYETTRKYTNGRAGNVNGKLCKH